MTSLTRLTAVLSLVGLLLGASHAEEAWRKILGIPELSFPRDHGAHPDCQTEWWYVTGTLSNDVGHPFGYQLTFFRRGLAPGPAPPDASNLRANQVLAAHFAVADVRKQEFRHSTRLRRAAGGLAGASEGDLSVWLEDWELRRDASGTLCLYASDIETGIGINLSLSPTKPLVRQGDGGLSIKGPEAGNASVYLSWTRLSTTGTLRWGKDEFPVSGESWFDHEWGTSQLGEGVVGWDWFGLRLEDGRELMLYRLRRVEGTQTDQSSGTLVQPDGSTERIVSTEFRITPVSTWTSPHTGAIYPSRWNVSLPSHQLELEVSALVPDCEIGSAGTTDVIYWEGPVRVEGSAIGMGYGELTGYAGSLSGRF